MLRAQPSQGRLARPQGVPLRMYSKSYEDLPGCNVRPRLMVANLPVC
jgi:hypothetical protein